MRTCSVCTPQILLECSNQGETEGRSVMHVWERGICRALWWGNLKEGVHLEDLGVDGSMILKQTLMG
jgi:hypothetical protein